MLNSFEKTQISSSWFTNSNIACKIHVMIRGCKTHEFGGKIGRMDAIRPKIKKTETDVDSKKV